ncbi:hypothetical protein [Treponema sp. OMZ 805]|uniref:hypothetical protein n=1 Tax=Treponema sp. OMZ 805 TaxID=2726068 RepID=UPI003D8E6AE8
MISGFNEADIADDFTLSFTFSQIGLLKIYGASTSSHWQKRTSLYAFASEFRRRRNSLLFNTSGIRAAVENPQRIRTDTDVREIKQQRVCPANSTLNSVHGRTLFNSAMDGGGSRQ